MIDIIQTAKLLLPLTQSGKVVWEYSDNIPCLTLTHKNENYIVCKAESGNKINFVSLNLLDENQNEIGDFNRWKEGDENYALIEQLYNVANEKSHHMA
jgi:hypothetical protein